MSTRKTPHAAEVAQVLGMKESEIVDVQLDADGVLAQTHDKNWTLIRDGGVLEFLGQDIGERAAVVGERGTEHVAPTGAAVTAAEPKGRGRA